MSFPSDIALPANSKYITFVDSKFQFNPSWDVNWSFEYALSGTNQHAFCTFLSTATTLSGYPGHYLGYTGTSSVSSYLLDDDGNFLLTDDGERLVVDTENGLDYAGILAVAFDSTGLFALSSQSRPGVGRGSLKRNSLIIRDDQNNVTFYEHLSNIDTGFVLSSSGKYYQKLRFRFSNMGKTLAIDYQKPNTSNYLYLTSVNLSIPTEDYPFVNVGFSYSSPVSSSVLSPSVMFLKNFHVQGNTYDTSIEEVPFISIEPTVSSLYTTLCSVSAT